MAESRSVLMPLGYQKSTCGYCKSAPQKTGANYYAISPPKAVLPSTYEAMMDRGWRRSGETFYKPDPVAACCPHYPIRLVANDFKPNRKQRHAANHWCRYMRGERYRRQAAMLCPRSRAQKRWRKCHFDLKGTLGDAEYRNILRPVEPSHAKPIEPEHSLKIVLEPDTYSDEKFALFQHYQTAVHHERLERNTETTFRRFLCSGLPQSSYVDPSGLQRPIGSYHQCYYLDDHLIAVGVLDLMPHSVSSVYLFYHTDAKNLRLGKISALNEIAFAQEHGYTYYHMGKWFYIHSCIKMRYKRTFGPCYLLDHETYAWRLFDHETLARLSTSLTSGAGSTTEEAGSLVCTSTPPQNSSTGNTDPPELVEEDESDDEMGPSVFQTNMPGIPSVQEISREIQMRNVTISLRDGRTFQLGQMMSEWEVEEMTKSDSLQCRIAELAACLGPKIFQSIAVGF